ncbi:MAG TPA: glycoside hydrolase family 2 TIM barrel-domain containing protein [Verrucomicrobiae bacterium]|nr:glycoside hydrolase family 2 TIM barrel-domain containing protein [Verrucomicrobiae bacterium]
MNLRLRPARTLFAALLFAASAFAERQTISFNPDWRFTRGDAAAAERPDYEDQQWERVTLPHTARVEALVAGKNSPQWQGLCWYRKAFTLPTSAAGKEVVLHFEGAMNTAEFWLNGEFLGRHMGGYLPCVLDISAAVLPGKTNLIAVRLDNRDNPITGPKPLPELDFNLYGGLYRGARLIIKDRLNISDPILANKVASGGIFVSFPAVSKSQATVRVQTHLHNKHQESRRFQLRTTLLDFQNREVIPSESTGQTLQPGEDREVVHELVVANPRLWSPGAPHLYNVRSEVLAGEHVVDSETTRIGIRRIEMTKDGFWINGEKMFLRGVNRHQEYPYIGNALSDAAQFRDALKIKSAGFDYIRLSHYPQSRAFMNACDELGLVVMNCLMGWQFFNSDPAFAELKLKECRELIRRDRNHPCVILWETSLNESAMPREFIAQAQKLSHEEYPGDQMFTCGWTRGFDVFIQARQHGGCKRVRDIPCLVSEYGDWEYFAQNAGLEQHRWKDLQPAERNSRQFRGDGEIRLLQQALNFQEAHNDNLKTTAFADGLWVMFDYNRGYAEDIEGSGVMDIFRLPKFSYWFYRSQRTPGEPLWNGAVEPMVFIANHWTAESPLDVRVFSNCKEVSLFLNGLLVERRQPDTDRFSTNLKHPPFTFTLKEYKPGQLRAVGHIGSRDVASAERRTPGAATRIQLQFDLSGKPFAASGKDAVFCHAELQDKDGTTVSIQPEVAYGTMGPVAFMGTNSLFAEAGIATGLLQTETANPECAVYALTIVPGENQWRVIGAGGTPGDRAVPSFELRYTTDGTVPTSSSRKFTQPVRQSETIHAGLFVNEKLVVAVKAASNNGPMSSN